MGFGGIAHKLAQSSAGGFQISGNTVRVVDRYVYLGVPFILTLDKKIMANTTKGSGSQRPAMGWFVLLAQSR